MYRKWRNSSLNNPYHTLVRTDRVCGIWANASPLHYPSQLSYGNFTLGTPYRWMWWVRRDPFSPPFNLDLFAFRKEQDADISHFLQPHIAKALFQGSTAEDFSIPSLLSRNSRLRVQGFPPLSSHPKNSPYGAEILLWIRKPKRPEAIILHPQCLFTEYGFHSTFPTSDPVQCRISAIGGDGEEGQKD